MSYDDSSEEGTYSETIYKMSTTELKLCAQIAARLELEVGVQKNIIIRVEGETAHLQGSVATHEIQKRIEEVLATQHGIRQFECKFQFLGTDIYDEH